MITAARNISSEIRFIPCMNLRSMFLGSLGSRLRKYKYVNICFHIFLNSADNKVSEIWIKPGMLSIFAPRYGGLAQLARASRHGGKVSGS